MTSGLFPPHCAGCSAVVTEVNQLCAACWSEVEFVTGLTCDLCGTPLQGESAQRELCDDCLCTTRAWEAGRAATVYAGKGRDLILSLKHADRPEIARTLGNWAANAARAIVTAETLVLPVPLHRRRLMKRRYNQSALIGRSLARVLGLEFRADALIRPKPTPMLQEAGAEARHAALLGAIVPNPSRPGLFGRHVLIVDDVMTTGATLQASAIAARTAGAAGVAVVVVARVAKGRF